MRFEHREPGSDADVVDLVWRTRSDTGDTMTSVARTCWHLILARVRGRVHAGLRGPETRAGTAPVPPDTEFLGVRFALGTVLRPYPVVSLVDGYAPIPVTDSGRLVIGGESWEAPTYESVERFVRRLREAGLLVRSRLGDAEHDHGGGPTERTRQRRYRAMTGLSPTAVRQIDRANAAATMLRDGADWPGVVEVLGYFDQAHLAHALRRFVGRTAGELRAGGHGAMSFLYKTRSRPGS